MKKVRLFSFITILILIFSMGGHVFAQAAPDADRDGIPDHLDGCKNQPGPRTNNGCPLSNNDDQESDTGRQDDVPPDSDGDGTADPLDSCPTVPGDGANGGCPVGTDPNASQNTDITIEVQLLPPPDSTDCIASPNIPFGVNMRADPNPYSPVLHVLQPNEWAKVLGVAPEGKNPFTAEHEFASLTLPFGFTYGQVDPDPDPDPEYDPNALWLFIMTDDFQMGWIALDVARLAGDCADFDELDNDPDYLSVFVLPNDDVSVHFPSENGFLIFPIFPDPPPTVQFDIRLPDEDEGESLDFAAECVLRDLGNGASLLECVDGSTPIFTYCLLELGSEAGIYEEVCYDVEVPDGCTVYSSEVGVWHFDCEEDDPIVVRPFGLDEMILTIGTVGSTNLNGINALVAVKQLK